MARMKETPADMQVKDLLWAATIKELTYFVEKGLEIHDIEDERKRKQARIDLADACRLKGYPISIINRLVTAKIKLVKAETAKKPNPQKIAEAKAIPAGVLLSYRNKLGLLQGGRRGK